MINGQLPEGWELTPLGEAADNLDGTRVPLKMSDRDQRHGDYPYYGASGVIDHIDDFLYDGQYLLVAEDGANLLARSTPIAFLASGRFWVNNHAHVLSFNGKASLSYLQRYLCSIDISRFVTGSAQPKLNQKNLDRIEIPLPPLAEQKRIADILDKADAVRRKRKMVIESLTSMRQAVLYDTVLSSKKRPDWREERLGDVADVKGGIAVSSRRNDLERKAPYLRVANVYRDHLDLSEIKEIGLTDDEFERTRLLAGDVLVVEGHGNRDEIGRSAIWDGSIADCVHQNHLIRVRPNESFVRAVYLSAFINSPLGRRQLFRFGKTTSGLNTISLSNVRDTVILLPPLALQQQMEQRIAVSIRLLNKLEEAIGHANGLFNTLVQRAFNGEL